VAQLRDLRLKSGLSLRALAAAIGSCASQVGDWENGRWPTEANLRRWGAALGVELAWVPVAYHVADEAVARTLDVAEQTIARSALAAPQRLERGSGSPPTPPR